MVFVDGKQYKPEAEPAGGRGQMSGMAGGSQ